MEITKRESTFSEEKMVGLGDFEVMEFNKPLDSEGKEIKYLGEKDGNTTLRLAITLKDKASGKYFPLSFYLENREVLTKDGLKKQYINPKGQTTYNDDIENLSPKFVAGGYHVARVGEADLAEFLNAWLDVNRSVPYDILPDWKLLMSGNVKELVSILRDANSQTDESKKITRSILALATVRTVEKDDKISEYQQIYNRRFLPGYTMKHFRLKQFTEAELDALREKAKVASQTKKWLENYEKFAIDVTDSQYGCKDSYYLGPLKPYVASENITAGDKVLSEEDANY